MPPAESLSPRAGRPPAASRAPRDRGAARLAADHPAEPPADAATGDAGWIQPQAAAFYDALYHRWLNHRSRLEPERKS